MTPRNVFPLQKHEKLSRFVGVLWELCHKKIHDLGRFGEGGSGADAASYLNEFDVLSIWWCDETFNQNDLKKIILDIEEYLEEFPDALIYNAADNGDDLILVITDNISNLLQNLSNIDWINRLSNPQLEEFLDLETSDEKDVFEVMMS